jgi:hypothetical protein
MSQVRKIYSRTLSLSLLPSDAFEFVKLFQ